MLHFVHIKKNFKTATSIALFLWLITSGGCTERQIATTTPYMDIPDDFLIRVLLEQDCKEAILRTKSGVTIFEANIPDKKYFLSYSPQCFKVKISNGTIKIADYQFTSDQVIIETSQPYIFSLNNFDYRGKLKIIANANGKTFDIINILPLEPYLAGVIAAEMPSYWEPAALKAQTITARTYCLYIKKRFGKNRNWDVKKTAANQMYRGIEAESSRIWNVVKKTKGKVLTCKSLNSSWEIFPTYYCSACGGHTENSQNVFGGDFYQPLAGVACPYCVQIAKPKNFYWSEITMTKSEITERILARYPKLKNLGQIVKISPHKKSEYKNENLTRITSVKLTGQAKKNAYLRAEDFRLALDSSGNKIKSTAFKIVDLGEKVTLVYGQGYGHAVGFCQCGAHQMARDGKNEYQILEHYFPHSKISNIY